MPNPWYSKCPITVTIMCDSDKTHVKLKQNYFHVLCILNLFKPDVTTTSGITAPHIV